MSRYSWILQKLANIFHDPRLPVLWLFSLCAGFKRAGSPYVAGKTSFEWDH